MLHTARGRVTAERVVIATNAWAANVPELVRRFVCVGSAVVATPPTPDRLRAIGWTGGESITDSQTTVNYYRTTRDGRIIFGKGGGRIYYTGAPGQLSFSDNLGISLAEADFRRVYPMLRDIPIERSWSEPIDRTYDSLQLLGTLTGAPSGMKLRTSMLLTLYYKLACSRYCCCGIMRPAFSLTAPNPSNLQVLFMLFINTPERTVASILWACIKGSELPCSQSATQT